MKMTAKTAKKKVLLVDDNEIIRMYVKDVFWIHGLESRFEFEAVDSVQKAEKIINGAKKPDIILLDLFMPAEEGKKGTSTADTGYSLLKQIKSSPKTKDIKVVIFSGFTEMSYRKKAMQLGADIYLVKNDHLPQDLVQFINDISKNA